MTLEYDMDMKESMDHIENRLQEILSHSRDKSDKTLSPRHLWLQKRIHECLEAINEARESNDINEYCNKLKALVVELKYVSEEWLKYYPE